MRVLIFLDESKSLRDSVNVRIDGEVRLIETEGEHDAGGLLPHALKF